MGGVLSTQWTGDKSRVLFLSCYFKRLLLTHNKKLEVKVKLSL